MTPTLIRDYLEEMTIQPDIWAELDDEEAVTLLEEIGDIKAAAGQIQKLLSRQIATRFKGSGAKIGHYELEKRMAGAKYVFAKDTDAELFASVVARGKDRQMFDKATGEILESREDAVARTIAEVWNLGARTARSGVLKDKLGLSIELFRTRTEAGLPEAHIKKQR